MKIINLLPLFLAICLLSACGNKEESTEQDTSSDKEESTEQDISSDQEEKTEEQNLENNFQDEGTNDRPLTEEEIFDLVNEQVLKLEAQLEQANAQIEALTKGKEGQSQDVAELQIKIRALEQEKAGLSAQISTLSQQKAELIQSTTATTSLSSLKGGSGGALFADLSPWGGRIQKIIIYSGWGVDSIQMIYERSNGSKVTFPKHGGKGGGRHEFSLSKGEYITKITGRAGKNYVGSITIHTNKRKSPKYGTAQGKWAGTYNFEIKAHSTKEIIGFYGRSGTYLNAIGAIVRTKPSTISKAISRPKGLPSTIYRRIRAK